MNARASSLSSASDAIAALKDDVPTNVVPVAGEQWRRSVTDADLPGSLAAYADRRRETADSAGAEGAAIGLRLRPAALGLVRAARDSCDRLELLAALAPEDPAPASAARAWRVAVVADARSVVAAVAKGESVPAPPTWPALPEVAADERDVLLAAFGVPTDDLVDSSGMFSQARLLAAYRMRLPLLQEACDRVLGLLAERPPSVFSGISSARDLVTSRSPWVTLATARQVRRMLIDASAADPERAAGVLAGMWDERDREWSSFVRLADRLRTVDSSKTQRERHVALVEAYKHMAEGLTRRWVWALLQLSGLDGEQPTVGQLVGPAVARLGAIGAWLERSLLVVVRNAEAHEDLDFDEDSGVLLVGDSQVEPEVLSTHLDGLDVLQRGWQAGLLAALQDCPSLVIEAPAQATKRSRSFDLEVAKQRFGHAGQVLRSFRRDGQRVDIELDDLRAEACNPCFVALTQSAVLLPNVSRFVIHVAGHPEPVIDLPSSVLQANWPVYVMAAERFPHALPQSTFVPCLAWARLACESVEQAARVAAWMVLNDSQHAIVDAEASHREALLLPDRLQLAAAAGEATIPLLTTGPHMQPLAQAVRVAYTSADVVARGVGGVAGEILLDRVARLRDRLDMRPAALPTLDPTPLAESQCPHVVS